MKRKGPGIARALFRIWSGKPDSNRRPQPWQGCALPTELFPREGRHFNHPAELVKRILADIGVPKLPPTLPLPLISVQIQVIARGLEKRAYTSIRATSAVLSRVSPEFQVNFGLSAWKSQVSHGHAENPHQADFRDLNRGEGI
jgi:hypothetical protein